MEILKDDKKYHGAVDESSSQQQFSKLDAMCENLEPYSYIVQVGLTAGSRPAVRQNTGTDRIVERYSVLPMCFG